jgi:hypothetical protein
MMKINYMVLHNKRCIQKIALMLLGSGDSEVAERALAALEETNKVANQRTCDLRRLWKKLDFIPIGSEAESPS